MTNPYYDILEMDGYRPRKLFESVRPISDNLVRKDNYAEIYKSDVLPSIAKYQKKAREKQEQRQQKQNTEHFNQKLPYKLAFQALEKVTIQHGDKEVNAMEMFFNLCIYELLTEIKKRKDFNPQRALINDWAEYFLLEVKAIYEAVKGLEALVVETSPKK